MVKNILTFAAIAALAVPALAQQETAAVDQTLIGSLKANTVLASSANISLTVGYDDTYKVQALNSENDEVKAISINGTVYTLGSGLAGSADPKAENKSPNLNTIVDAGAVFQLKAEADGYVYLITKFRGAKEHYVYNVSKDYYVAYSVSAFDAAGNQYEFTLPAAEDGSDVFTKYEDGTKNATDAQKGYMNTTKLKTLINCHKQANGGTTTWSDAKDQDGAAGVIAFRVKKGDSYNFYGSGTKPAVSAYVFLAGETTLGEVKAADVPSTALKTVIAEDPDAPVFNLLGQRVQKGYKGICIQNGKVFIRK